MSAEPETLGDDHVELRPKQLWVRGYSAWIFRFRWLVLALSLAVVVVTGYGARYLEVDPDTRLFFSLTSPERKALEHLEETYGKRTNVIVVVSPDDGNVFTPEALNVISQVTEAAWSIPFASRVDSLTNYKYSYANGDEFVVEDLVPEGATITDASAAEVRTKALAEPELVDQLVSAKGDVSGINVTIVRPQNQRKSVPEIARYAENMVAGLRAAHPDYHFYISGGIMADWAFAEATYRDMRSLLPLMVVFVVGCLWLGFRSISSVLASIVVVILSMVAAMGVAGWAGTTLNSMTVGAPVMSTTLAIADCVHLIAGAGQLRRKGIDYRTAIAESLRINWTPIFLTSLTTAISFLTLNYADSPPLQDVGNIVGVGVTAAWIMTVTTLPALLIVLPEPRRLTTLSDPRFFNWMSDAVLKYKTPLLVCSLALVGILAIGASRLKFDDDFIKYFSPAFEFRRDTEFMQNRLTGLHTLFYSVPAGEENGVTRPEYLEKLNEFAEWFRTQPHVSHVSLITDTLKRLNKNMHEDDPSYYKVPESKELAAQYLLLYEMSLPEGFDVNSEIDIGKSASKVSVHLSNVTSEQIKTLALSGENWLKEHGLAAAATGLSIMYAYLTENNIQTMVAGTFFELIGISFLMIVMVRSVKIGLLSLIPNLSPALLAFGIWGWLGSEVNLAISVVAAMTFGIIVDDTIHTLIKYMRARRDLGMDANQAIHYTYVTVGEPMLLTGATLVFGFGILSFSGFAVNHQLGILSALIITLAIFADLVMLPPLLVLFDRKK